MRARYDVLAKWWADVMKPTTRLYIGIALYKVGEPSKNEPDWTIEGGVPELKSKLTSMNLHQTSTEPSCSAKVIWSNRKPSRRLII